jgi:hypothetical protein
VQVNDRLPFMSQLYNEMPPLKSIQAKCLESSNWKRIFANYKRRPSNAAGQIQFGTIFFGL